MKYTLHDLQKSLSCLEHFGLINQVGGKPAQNRAEVIKKLNGKTPRAGRTKMTPEKIDQIWGLHNQSWRHREIAKEVGCHVGTVGRVLRNETV